VVNHVRGRECGGGGHTSTTPPIKWAIHKTAITVANIAHVAQSIQLPIHLSIECQNRNVGIQSTVLVLNAKLSKIKPHWQDGAGNIY